MEKHISIAPQINPTWRDRVDSQVKVKLGSLASRLSSLNVELHPHPAMTECAVRAVTRDGHTITYSTINSDPEISISDAIARLRRETMRRYRLKRVS